MTAGHPRTATLIPLLVLLLALLNAPAAAQQTPTSDWEPTGLAEPVLRLYTPTSGAFFARTTEGLLRSDDGGLSWAAVSLPAPLARSRYAVEVDPIDHTTIYAGTEAGLYRTTDDTATWQLILPPDPSLPNVLGVAASPADRSLLYAALGQYDRERFLRSRDGGAGWETLAEHQYSLCSWAFALLQPHPTDPSRAFRTYDCYAGRNMGDDLEQTTDQGASWSTLIRPELAFPVRLAGGAGAQPERFYLGANRDPRGGGSLLFRSDDDGATWSRLLAHTGGGTIEHPAEPNVTIGGLAFDPAAPDRVYLGLNAKLGEQTSGLVRVSWDGGLSWANLGNRDLGTIRDLVLGIDGLNLYVAGEQGVFRMPIAP